jgi:type IV secretion system protein VirB4
MPFDPEIGFDTDPQYQPVLFYETPGSEFVPDLHHIAEDLVLHSDGSVQAMLRIRPFPFELESMRARNIRRRQINDLIRGLADNNVTLCLHLCHHDHVPPFRWGRFRSRFASRLFAKYQQNCLNGLMANDWFITVIVSPRFLPGRALRRRLAAVFRRRAAAATASPSIVRQINGIMQSLTAYFRPTGVKRLGLRDDPERGRCSEIAEARRLMIMGRWQAVPLTTGVLASAIYTERVVCGSIAVRIHGLDGPRYAKTIALRDYPSEETYTGQFSHFIQVKADEQHSFVMGQTFRIQSREGAAARLYLKLTRMTNAFDVQKKGMAKLEDAREEVASGETVRGIHNFGYTVFAPDIDALHRAASTAGAAINKGGCSPIAEDGGSFGAFWSALPGNPDWLEGRSGGISGRNLTAFASLEGFPTGSSEGFWGPAILRFANSGGSAWDFVTHVGDIGHAVFIGRSTSGKTLLVLLLLCALEQSLNEEDRVFYFDKVQGAEPAIRASGGAYLSLKAGQPSGMAPLRGFPDTPEARAVLVQLIGALMTSDGLGALETRTHTMLRRAVARQMRLPPSERRLGAVRAFLGYGKGTDGERLDRWCEGGADGWLFDNTEDLITTDAPIVGFDLTQLFDHPACSHVAFYLMARIREVIDGRRITVVCDEVRAYLNKEEFEEFILDFSFTLRKKNGQLWILGQEPSHIINSKLGSGLANQAQTMWLYPARDANPDEYKRLGCTQSMYRAITETMPTLGYRCVLLKREEGSVILRTELTGMEDEITVLSGREETVRLIPAILGKVGNDPDAFAEEFTFRCAEQRRKRDRRHAQIEFAG